MENFAKLFARVEHGMWRCVQDGEFASPHGLIRVTVGSTFVRGTSLNGFDIAKWLDEQNGIRRTI